MYLLRILHSESDGITQPKCLRAGSATLALMTFMLTFRSNFHHIAYLSIVTICVIFLGLDFRSQKSREGGNQISCLLCTLIISLWFLLAHDRERKSGARFEVRKCGLSLSFQRVVRPRDRWMARYRWKALIAGRNPIFMRSPHEFSELFIREDSRRKRRHLFGKGDGVKSLAGRREEERCDMRSSHFPNLLLKVWDEFGI